MFIHKTITIIFILLFITNMKAQDNLFIEDLSSNYHQFLEQSLDNRRIKYNDLIPLFNKIKKNRLFTIDTAGKSAEGRTIYLIKYGTGATKVFLWSQMHGDESTATMALFDLINFLTDESSYVELKKLIKENITIYIMPMVNPDGAEVFQRRNSFEIDLNRDFNNLATPEAKILRGTFEKIKPDFGFNLHDQNFTYASGNHFKNAALSFLAPSPNMEKEITPNRLNAIKVISGMCKMLSQIIPGHLGKYDDEFEPRAFGDNFQKAGAATILIESGAWKDDPERQFIRKLNFLAICKALNIIADKSYEAEDTSAYNNLCFNKEILKSLILRNVTFKESKKTYRCDISIMRDEINIKDSKDYYVKSYIEDIGDLSNCYGIEEYDFSGYTVEPGQVYKKRFHSTDSIPANELNDLLKKGYLFLKVKKLPKEELYSPVPVNYILNGKTKFYIKVDSNADFIIKKDDKPAYAVINGFLYNIIEHTGEVKNALIYR